MFIPTKDDDVSYAPVVFAEGAFYVIGGWLSSTSRGTTIAKLDSTSYKWFNSGDLLTGRRYHNAIFDGSNIMVVGGYTLSDVLLKTEKCTIAGDKVNCVEQDPSIYDYVHYPELFLVEEGYCKKLSSIWLFK